VTHRILVSAGDASGDAHAADVVTALRAVRPDTSFVGLGGEACRGAGVDVRVPLRDVAIGGLVEVLGHVPRVIGAWRTLERTAREAPTRLAVLVDAPDLNLPLARRLRRIGVPILYYVAPQVWAWRTGRIRRLAQRVDRMAVIFPFEVDAFRARGVRVDFVGHPLVDRLRSLRARSDRQSARAALGIEPDRPLLLLLPGSRRNEIRAMLDLHLRCAEALRAREPNLSVVLALAQSVARDDVEEGLAAHPQLAVRIVEGGAHAAMIAADVALTKPGTANLELAFLGCPFVVAGRAHPLSAAVMRRLVQVPSWSLPNLLAGAPVVPEFLQEAARPDRVAAALAELLRGPARRLALGRLREVARRLGTGGAAERTAAIANEMIDGGLAG
jgi:lipid-A-disaccharide synthase